MATKKAVKKKNPRWVAVLEDVWAYDDSDNTPVSKAELMDGLDQLFNDYSAGLRVLPGFKVVKLTREQPAKK